MNRHKSIAMCALMAGVSLCFADLGNERLKLLPSDGAAYDYFGRVVAVSGPLAAVGSFSGAFGTESGATYVFDCATGAQLVKITPSDAAADDRFGSAVAMEGTTLLVGADYDDEVAVNCGSAYVSDLTDPHNPAELRKLLAEDGAQDDRFGTSVAISGARAIVGAAFDDDLGEDSGSAYIFNVTTGQQVHKLTAADGAADDHFGWSVGISGSIAIVGTLAYVEGRTAGAAYLFDVNTGAQLAKLLPADSTIDDEFGISVAMCGPSAIVGADKTDDRGAWSGAAYLYDASDPHNPVQISKLLPHDAAAGDRFGRAVALSGGTALIGSFADDEYGVESGAAYLFNAVTGVELVKLLPADGEWENRFGFSVAISGDKALIGAHFDRDNGDRSGSAYLFESRAACVADITTQGAGASDPLWGVPDGLVTAADLNYYVNDWVVGSPAADVTTQGAPEGDPLFGVPDGLVSGADLNYFVNGWIVGCP